MKYIFCALFMVFVFSSDGQDNKLVEFTYENFDTEILKYEPIKKRDVSEKDFQKGLFKLNETKKAVNGDPKNLNYADYWNITMAFVNLDESSKNIEISFNKAIQLNSTDVCTIIKSFGNSQLDIRIPDTFYPFVKGCSDEKINENFDVENYSQKNQLDKDLISAINQIYLNDIKFRFDKPVDWNKQKPLDINNQKSIDSLFTIYNTYLGKSLVGEKFEAVMWLTIQHSNIEMMEKYLPIIQEAVENNEIGKTPFKMLIDRIYSTKKNYQIFGSQVGVEQASEEIRQEVIKKYKLE